MPAAHQQSGNRYIAATPQYCYRFGDVNTLIAVITIRRLIPRRTSAARLRHAFSLAYATMS